MEDGRTEETGSIFSERLLKDFNGLYKKKERELIIQDDLMSQVTQEKLVT